MTRTITRELTITLRVVEQITDDDTDKPSLPPGPAAHVYDVEGSEVTSVRGPSLAKCRALPAGKRRAG